MRQYNLFEICHGCAREVYTYEKHWKVKLARVEKPVYFHHMCYVHYRDTNPQKVMYAEQKEK